MDIRPIRTDAEYDLVLAELEVCFDSEPLVGTPEADRFEVLFARVEAYEDKHWPIEAPETLAA
jgi:HTH-type transcriptional regulator / antitoxin HigA